jgi:hypothetical protein
MSNEIGNQVSSSLEEYRAKQKAVREEHDKLKLTSESRINGGGHSTADWMTSLRTCGIPQATEYRAIVNATGEERTLAGAKLLNFIKDTCGSLTYWTVMMRMTFIRA